MRILFVALSLLGILTCSTLLHAQTTTNFTYQGYLEDGGVPANGTYDFYFQLFDLPTLGTQQGTNRYAPDTVVTNGQFTVLLDWGYAVFPGAPRFLEIYVRPGTSTGAYTKLTPRQQLTPVPYALAALNAWRLGGNGFTTAGANFLGTTDNQAFEIKVNNQRVMRYEPGYYPNVLGGSEFNQIKHDAYGATIAGGGVTYNSPNQIYDAFCTIGGGASNCAGTDDNTNYNAQGATVAGGIGNYAMGEYATVAGGGGNHVVADRAAICGGYDNEATGKYTFIGGGYVNVASGYAAMIPGGFYNTASGDYSFAAGWRAQATAAGSFAWADNSTADYFTVGTPNRFGVRASGGVYLYTNNTLNSGAYLPSGSGTWYNLSDRNAKTDYTALDPKTVLKQLMCIPVSSWRYKSEDASIRHYGPMAQDFNAAFHLGDSDKAIATVDADGVALAAIQGLYQQSQEENARLKARIAALEQKAAKADAMEQRLAALEALVKKLAAQPGR